MLSGPFLQMFLFHFQCYTSGLVHTGMLWRLQCLYSRRCLNAVHRTLQGTMSKALWMLTKFRLEGRLPCNWLLNDDSQLPLLALDTACQGFSLVFLCLIFSLLLTFYHVACWATFYGLSLVFFIFLVLRHHLGLSMLGICWSEWLPAEGVGLCYPKTNILNVLPVECLMPSHILGLKNIIGLIILFHHSYQVPRCGP